MTEDPDPHGQAALMICEALMIVLIEQGVLSRELALGTLETVIEVKQEIAGTTERVVVSIASIGLLRAVAQSLAAVTLSTPAAREPSDPPPVDAVTPGRDMPRYCG